MGKNQHVTPHPAGGWQVKGEGNTRATVRTATQKQAMDIASEISRNQHSASGIRTLTGMIHSRREAKNRQRGYVVRAYPLCFK